MGSLKNCFSQSESPSAKGRTELHNIRARHFPFSKFAVSPYWEALLGPWRHLVTDLFYENPDLCEHSA